MLEWSQWRQMADVTVGLINTQGIHRGVADLLAVQLSQLDGLHDSAAGLRQELVAFVRLQESLVRPGERLPGSTEVLEPCFGKYKQLEKQHSRGGFTQLLPAFGAMRGELSEGLVPEAMRASRTLDVRRWAAEKLGHTLFAKRKQAYAGAIKAR